jgi:hypothetical protein
VLLGFDTEQQMRNFIKGYRRDFVLSRACRPKPVGRRCMHNAYLRKHQIGRAES